MRLITVATARTEGTVSLDFGFLSLDGVLSLGNLMHGVEP